MTQTRNDSMPARSDLEARTADHLHRSTPATGAPSYGEVRRRGRRRQAARRAAMGGLALVVVSGLVTAAALVTGGGRPDELTVSNPDVSAPEAGPATTVPGPTVTVPAPGDPVGPSAVASGPYLGAPIVAWGDGFLAIETVSGPQEIPELSEEVLALFPQEVLDLFDSQPRTIEEAFDVLNRHPDQLRAVQRVLAEHPEAMEAIYGTPVEMTVQLRASTDGRDWQLVGELPMPDGMGWIQHAAAYDGRIVVVGSGMLGVGPVDPASSWHSPAEQVMIATTVDLRSWERTEVLGHPEPLDAPHGFRPTSYTTGVALGPSGVIVAVEETAHLDAEALLPDELRERLGRTGYGMSSDPGGITITVGGDDIDIDDDGSTATTVVDWASEIAGSATGETIRFTWDDLGVDPGLAVDPISRVSVWTGDPSTGLVRSDVAGVDGGTVVAAPRSGGFVLAGGGGGLQVRSSTDGVVWDVETLDPSGTAWPAALVAGGSATVLIAHGGPGSDVAWRLDPALGSWSAVPVPALGDPASWLSASWGGEAGMALVVSRSPEIDQLASLGAIAVERDGYRLEVHPGDPESPTRLVRLDPAGDEVVLELPPVEWFESPRVRYDPDGSMQVLDTDGSAPLVRFGGNDIASAIDAARTAAGLPPSTGEGAMTHDVVFSADGGTWVVLDRIAGEADEDVYVSGVAVGARSVLAVVERHGAANPAGFVEYRRYDL